MEPGSGHSISKSILQLQQQEVWLVRKSWLSKMWEDTKTVKDKAKRKEEEIEVQDLRSIENGLLV